VRLLLITPPMTQLNTPYPATAYLTGFLRLHATRLALEVVQADAALELFLRIYSRAGLTRVLGELRGRRVESEAVASFVEQGEQYVDTVDAAIRFLQGRDPGLALRIASGDFLPQGPRFASIAEGPGAEDADPLAWAFGQLGVADRAKHLASLYVDDIADVLRDGIDPEFALSRYQEKIAAEAPTFDGIARALAGKPTLVDTMLDEIARELVERHRPDVVGLTAPFPGNVYGAFRIARAAKAVSPAIRAVLGGGYVNTELRELTDPRVFDTFDFITVDDGEAPFVALLEHLRDASKPLFRTYVCRDGAVELATTDAIHDVPLRDAGTPSYVGLPLDRYVSLFEMLNPMHRLWSDGRWNKLTIAHGCYWKQCTFCDVTLDYIARYDRAPAELLVDRIEAMIAETGQTGFHFVDEAAPPAALRALAEELLRRRVTITWWGNVRFEKAFTPELAELLARSGCVAISGGLEVASDRLLALMKKGVTVEQVARVTRAFTDAGVMVHAYLMFGFPTETAQETIDSLERVRQLFEEGCIQSAFWHRFAATAHSPIGREPQLYGITLRKGPKITFAKNEVAFDDPTGTDHDFFAPGLRKALYNYMHGLGFEKDPRSWFGKGFARLPRVSVARDLVRRALAEADQG
jgi:radical SAM superfamily enzyme YgiQ (UPF0313 family)